VSFLRENKNSPDPIKQYVEWCAENCHHMQAAIRKNPPSTVEITVLISNGILCLMNILILNEHFRQ